MGICFNHIYFRPKISAACFKISFSILNCWFSFRSRISSSCSGVRLSFSWKEPELDACFTHLSNREVAMSYSRQISHLRLPERYSSTSCCLNSSVYLRGFLRCLGSVIMSAPLCIYYRLYDLKKSVQLIVAYPSCPKRRSGNFRQTSSSFLITGVMRLHFLVVLPEQCTYNIQPSNSKK